MERIIELTPAYDKRNPDPSKNYGIQGVSMRMVLKGDKGAVQFLLFTNWMLPHIYKEWKGTKYDDLTIECRYKPMAADLGYHSLSPIYEGQTTISDKCEYLDGKPCYYDGSGLNAEKVFDILVREGGEAVWKFLENYYNEIFGGN